MENLPHVTVHMSVSIDGRTNWNGPDVALHYEIAASFREDATLAGSDTIRLFSGDGPGDEDLSVFEQRQASPGDARPVLFVPDSRGRVKNWHFLKTLPYWRDMVSLCSQLTPREHLEYLNARHIRPVVAGSDHVDYRSALDIMGREYGVERVRVDSGGTLAGILIREGLVDRVSLLVEPCIAGGASKEVAFPPAIWSGMSAPVGFSLTRCEALRRGIAWLVYETRN